MGEEGGCIIAYTESFLTLGVALAREHIDEPLVNKKYTDARIIRMLEHSYVLVLAEKNRNAQTPIIAKVTVTPVSGTTAYILPFTVGSVESIYQAGDYGTKVFFSRRSNYNPCGHNLRIEGNTLNLQNATLFGLDTDLTVEYTPAGVARLHNGVLAAAINTDGDEVTLAATPNAGTLDTHPDAYVGSVFRLLEIDGTTVTNNYMQERTISAYDHTTRVATLSPALDPIGTTDDGDIYYEIAPAIHKGMDLVVPLHTAMTIAGIEGNEKRYRGIRLAYSEAIRNVRLTAYYSNIQEAALLHSDSFDNRFF